MESTIHLRRAGDTVTVKVSDDLGHKKSLRKDLLAALGEEMTHDKRLEEEPSLERELAWRRGHNACRASLLDAINRLLP